MTIAKPQHILPIAIDVWAALMVLSLMLYAFAGLAFWSPLERNEHGYVTDGIRVMALIVFHVLPIIVAGVRRIP